MSEGGVVCEVLGDGEDGGEGRQCLLAHLTCAASLPACLICPSPFTLSL